MWRIASWLAACVLPVLTMPGAAIAAPAPLFPGYNLTSWTQKDGVTSSLIWALAQDPIGYLWIGTDAGMLRFDGVRFVPWENLAPIANPRVSVRSLHASPDGTLWFGLAEPGGVGALINGNVRIYGAKDGLPEGMVMSLARGENGALLAAGRFGLYSLASDRWHPVHGLPPGLVNDVVIEPDGGLIAATATGVFRRGHGERQFVPLGDTRDVARSLARSGDGRTWVTDPIVAFRPALDDRAQFPPVLKGRGSRLLYDSRGTLWVGTGGQGLWRLRPTADGAPPNLERTSTATGLSDDGVTAMLEDREGNIWVATRDGLNRLTPHKLTPITDLGLVSAVETIPGDGVFVGTADAVVAFRGGRTASRSTPIPFRNPPLTAMHADERGALWIATARELLRVADDRARPVRLEGGRFDALSNITSDGAGGLWLHDSTHGLSRWRDGVLTAAPLPKELKPAELLASHTDRAGRAWFSFQNNRVAVIKPSGAVHVYAEPDGLSAGPYRAIHQDGSGAIWLGGTDGVTRFADGTFATLAVFGADASRPVTGIVDDDQGALWIALNAGGLLRLSAVEIERALSDRTYSPRFSAYDKVDGSAGTSRWFGNRAAVRAEDGRLWFVAGRGVTVVDSDLLEGERRGADAVRIEGAVIDGRPLSTSATDVLPPRTARVQIDYTVLNLTSPHKTRFQHQLVGFDADWIDAEGGHSAFYTNLPPRDYVFRVMATGADGILATPAAEWRFTIPPMFHQTWWFAIACLAATGLTIGAAWRVHVLRVRQQFALLLSERARLSREVHDTLLQSMFGFALQCDALAEAVPPAEHQLRQRLGRLRHDVEDHIREARQSIWNLRSPHSENQSFASAFKEAAELAVASVSSRFSFELIGTPRQASADVEEQLMRIGREAISNAVRHAQASSITASLAYEDGVITLTVADDGRGFEPVTPSQRSDHFGLTTMRERADLVGGELRIESRPGVGTSVTAVIPTRKA